MKMRISKNNLASFLCGGVVCLTACISMGSNDVEKVIESRPVVSSMTLSPDVPSSVPFCGKLIDITRYDMREAYDRELSSFTYFHSTTMLLIKRANRYFPVIEPILKANGIPDDFKYLAVIESHLDPRVSSPARAVGMWQLLEGTAREYGLTITPTVDERCHVEKATGAACRYLKAAYKKYGDWVAAWDVYPVSWSNKMRIPPLISGWWRRLPVIFIESWRSSKFSRIRRSTVLCFVPVTCISRSLP